MIRKLTEMESKIMKSKEKKLKKDIEDYESNLKYNQALVKRQKENRQFEDQWRPYLRRSKDLEDERIVKSLNSEIKMKKETIKDVQHQLKNGVNVVNSAVGIE